MKVGCRTTFGSREAHRTTYGPLSFWRES